MPDEESSAEKETRTKDQCYAEMRKAVQAEFDKGCDLPTVTLKVDFVNCADTEEYRQYPRGVALRPERKLLRAVRAQAQDTGRGHAGSIPARGCGAGKAEAE